ncbi:DUF4266 domain-containing protein [Methylomarinum sp. Ch1-1]|uniref:DUF4266 domain-containing protein n=1 Tax=Methylomarinum roseum TaxID=3067653 RepID=A0AAU7NVX1_9GAMM|nr:DUF4266 domain-containing protein [Methylomarinum sp. Ch1-1]MDP4522814.1 DUF4266 domain-containing protein [Methylomarinum sp. Ch1-1]
MPSTTPALCLGSILLVTGCAPNVMPWERGLLAKPHMAFQPNAIEASLRQHMLISKEASSGGHGGGGGGCGCN